MIALANDRIRIEVGSDGGVSAVAVRNGLEWRKIAEREVEDGFFGGVPFAGPREVRSQQDPDGTQQVTIRRTDRERGWSVVQTLTLKPGEMRLCRRHHYLFHKPWNGTIRPGWIVPDRAGLLYTFPMYQHEVPLGQVKAWRADVEWALPVPTHVWHDGSVLAGYGVCKPGSAGSLDVHRAGTSLAACICFPDRCANPLTPEEQLFRPANPTETIGFGAGYRLTLDDVLWAAPLTTDAEPLFEAMRVSAGLFLRPPRPPVPAAAAAGRIAHFFGHCGLWNPDALGKGRGWFHTLWTNTHGAGDAGYTETYDLGWGEGIAAESIPALVRHARRTGTREFDVYIDEMSRNAACFQRRPASDEPYFDRACLQNERLVFGDFCLPWRPDPKESRQIWTHSAGHLALQFAELAQFAADWPNATTVERWRTVAGNTARYYARLQRPDGDLPDVTGDDDREVHRNTRIAARVVVAGLWTRWAQLCGDNAYFERARRLIEAVAPQIERYEYLNQMCDALQAPVECSDGEAGCYALEGLVPYYEVTGDERVGRLCRQGWAWVMMWTYFYDLPHAHEGIARGGQCCRLPDYPLLYPIGPAKAMGPFLTLARLTGDPLYARMADEMAYFIARNIHHCPGKPWDGGAVHAIDQRNGKYWNATPCTGQVDTGMSSGNSLAALEKWLDSKEYRA